MGMVQSNNVSGILCLEWEMVGYHGSLCYACQAVTHRTQLKASVGFLSVGWMSHRTLKMLLLCMGGGGGGSTYFSALIYPVPDSESEDASTSNLKSSDRSAGECKYHRQWCDM